MVSVGEGATVAVLPDRSGVEVGKGTTVSVEVGTRASKVAGTMVSI
jgi:hypothetical protein